MKFLLHGNAPTVKTGYGVQLKLLGQQLAADGHEVAYSSTYGFQSGLTTWQGFRMYGCGYDINSNDLIHQHAQHWFRGEPGWIITCVDVWALENPLLAELNVAAWVPIDHYLPTGCQPSVHEFFERSKAVPIAMSRFGEDMLRRRGHDPIFVPLSVDTTVFKPTDTLQPDTGEITGRDLLDLTDPIPDDAFIVGMVAMNKGWAKDRKGFNEAFRAFGIFDQLHPEANAHLYVHAENLGGAEGINLMELAVFCNIQAHKIHWAGGKQQYSYRLGYDEPMMAATYTAMDVLLAPSHGEGFCVPLIEAQACGTPVIATNFSAQAELVPEGCGWLVEGQPEWDPPHHAEYVTPYIGDIVFKLEEAWKADLDTMAEACIEHAKTYDTAHVYETMWKPTIAELTATPDSLPLEREPMPAENAVAVLCPLYKRTENLEELMASFKQTTPPGAATLYLIDEDADRNPPNEAIKELQRTRGESCAQGWNAGYEQTTEPWVLCIGDDVRFHDGWLDNARDLSAHFDVIGTNDTTGPVKNPKVANGSHADHFFVRREYVDEYGACLDGPGVLAPEAYRHWYTDMEIIGLARARGVFSPCLDSVVEHLHPGYDGREDLREQDPTYMLAAKSSAADHQTYMERLPLIEQQRTTRAKL